MCFKYLFLYSLNRFFLEEMPYIYISELLTGRLEKKNKAKQWKEVAKQQDITKSHTRLHPQSKVKIIHVHIHLTETDSV